MSLANYLKSEVGNVIIDNAGVKYINDTFFVTSSTYKTADQWGTAEATVANYTVLAKTPSGDKETFNITVLADKFAVSHTVFGRVNFGTELLDVQCTVTSGIVKVKLIGKTPEKASVSIAKSYVGPL